jgi:hypothetical protein
VRRKTKKIKAAADILANESIADDDPHFVLDLYIRGQVSEEQIYKAVEHFGFRWKNGRWSLTLPRWLQNACDKRDRKLMESWAIPRQRIQQNSEWDNIR